MAAELLTSLLRNVEPNEVSANACEASAYTTSSCHRATPEAGRYHGLGLRSSLHRWALCLRTRRRDMVIQTSGEKGLLTGPTSLSSPRTAYLCCLQGVPKRTGRGRIQCCHGLVRIQLMRQCVILHGHWQSPAVAASVHFLPISCGSRNIPVKHSHQVTLLGGVAGQKDMWPRA